MITARQCFVNINSGIPDLEKVARQLLKQSQVSAVSTQAFEKTKGAYREFLTANKATLVSDKVVSRVRGGGNGEIVAKVVGQSAYQGWRDQARSFQKQLNDAKAGVDIQIALKSQTPKAKPATPAAA